MMVSHSTNFTRLQCTSCPNLIISGVCLLFFKSAQSNRAWRENECNPKDTRSSRYVLLGTIIIWDASFCKLTLTELLTYSGILIHAGSGHSKIDLTRLQYNKIVFPLDVVT